MTTQRSSYYVYLSVEVSLAQLCITSNTKITRVTCWYHKEPTHSFACVLIGILGVCLWP